MPAFIAGPPGIELADTGLEVLIGVETGILPQQRSGQNDDQLLRIVTEKQVAGCQPRGVAYPGLAVKGGQQPIEELVRRLRQIIEGTSILAGHPRRRDIQEPGEVQGHGAGKDAGRRIGIRIAGFVQTLQDCVQGIGVGEDMVRRVPVRKLVRRPETGQTERGGVGQRPSQIGRPRPVAHGLFQRRDDLVRLIAEQPPGQIGVRLVRIRPGRIGKAPAHSLPRRIHEGDKVDGMPPGIRFFAPARPDHLVDGRGKDRHGPVTADQFSRFERLVHEVQAMAGVPVMPVGRRSRHAVDDLFPGPGRRNHGFQRPFGGGPVPDAGPLAQPPFEGLSVQVGIEKRSGGLIRLLSGAIRRHPAHTVEQRQKRLVLRQAVDDVSERRQDGHANVETVAIANAVIGRRGDDVPAARAGIQAGQDRLAHYQRDVMAHAVMKALTPTAGAARRLQTARNPNLVTVYPDLGGGNIVGPQIEGAAAR